MHLALTLAAGVAVAVLVWICLPVRRVVLHDPPAARRELNGELARDQLRPLQVSLLPRRLVRCDERLAHVHVCILAAIDVGCLQSAVEAVDVQPVRRLVEARLCKVHERRQVGIDLWDARHLRVGEREKPKRDRVAPLGAIGHLAVCSDNPAEATMVLVVVTLR